MLQWIFRFGVPIVFPDTLLFAVFSGLIGGLTVVVWWAFFSRAPRFERWGAIVLMIVALGATSRFLHPSIAGGMMGMMFPIFAIPVLSLAFVLWAVASRGLSETLRRASMVATILLACGVWTLFRTNGITGGATSDFAWRWSPTAEQRLLYHANDKLAPTTEKIPEAKLGTQVDDKPTALPPTSALATSKSAVDWPSFRGPHRDGIIPGLRIESDWSKSPPIELWRRPIGPGWSSFAVGGDLIYTQEQRGDDEVVACYKITTGEPVWRHRDAARFWESNGGAGPRATPTLSSGRVYTFGATGILNALDAGNGTVVWSRNVASDSGMKVPGWGFASSPLVVDGVVIVAAAGKLVAYDIANGDRNWLGPDGGAGYSSPHLVTIGSVPQVLLMSGNGVIGVAPADGNILWEYPLPPGARIVQPAQIADGDILISDDEARGVRRITVVHGPAGWAVEERWISTGLKPYFNDFVVHKGHAFGFDGSILSCIDLKDGKRQWKGGRYGHGQLELLADQDLLLVLSEEGELALVAAVANQFKELARFPAIEGKTWNHPVLVGNILLVRNGQEMVAFRLTLARL